MEEGGRSRFEDVEPFYWVARGYADGRECIRNTRIRSLEMYPPTWIDTDRQRDTHVEGWVPWAKLMAVPELKWGYRLWFQTTRGLQGSQLQNHVVIQTTRVCEEHALTRRRVRKNEISCTTLNLRWQRGRSCPKTGGSFHTLATLYQQL